MLIFSRIGRARGMAIRAQWHSLYQILRFSWCQDSGEAIPLFLIMTEGHIEGNPGPMMFYHEFLFSCQYLIGESACMILYPVCHTVTAVGQWTNQTGKIPTHILCVPGVKSCGLWKMAEQTLDFPLCILFVRTGMVLLKLIGCNRKSFPKHEITRAYYSLLLYSPKRYSKSNMVAYSVSGNRQVRYYFLK